MKLPEIDNKIWAGFRLATPLTKMPNCPNCGTDELGMIDKGKAVCYFCQMIIKDLTNPPSKA